MDNSSLQGWYSHCPGCHSQRGPGGDSEKEPIRLRKWSNTSCVFGSTHTVIAYPLLSPDVHINRAHRTGWGNSSSSPLSHTCTLHFKAHLLFWDNLVMHIMPFWKEESGRLVLAEDSKSNCFLLQMRELTSRIETTKISSWYHNVIAQKPR